MVVCYCTRIISATLGSSYPEWAVGDIDLTPGNDNCVLNWLSRDIDTEESTVAVVRDLDVDRKAF